MRTMNDRGSKDAKRPLRRAHVVRLMHYYHLLREWIGRGNGDTVSSSQIAEWLELDDTLVRKDLAAIGVRGCPRIGYAAAEVIDAIHKNLGFEDQHRAIVVGAGRLGGAIAAYPGFARYGLTIVGIVDNDPDKLGQDIAEHRVLPLDALPDLVRERQVDVVILTLPAEAAQDAADRAVTAGIRAIWSFAPTSISVPPEVKVRHEHLSTGFAELAYHLKQTSPEGK
jgi:redox-sensing transcriptional repressor